MPETVCETPVATGHVQTVGVDSLGHALYRALSITNSIEHLNGSIAHFTRNVKRLKDGAMTLRWVAVDLSDAKGRVRKLPGHREMMLLMTVLAPRQTAVRASEKKAA